MGFAGLLGAVAGQVGETGFVATGGTENPYTGYKSHKFTAAGSFTVTSGTSTVELILVGGGGGGGPGPTNYKAGAGGGGGGGVMVTSTTVSSDGGPAGDGVYPIYVGAGGAELIPGASTSFNGPGPGPGAIWTQKALVAWGGGAEMGSIGGGKSQSNGTGGGGGSYGHPSYRAGEPGSEVVGGIAVGAKWYPPAPGQGLQGWSGGIGGTKICPPSETGFTGTGGGGGGAGGAGQHSGYDADPQTDVGGDGGVGTPNVYETGSAQYYGGGGGGSAGVAPSGTMGLGGGPSGLGNPGTYGDSAITNPNPANSSPSGRGGNDGAPAQGGGGGGTAGGGPVTLYGGSGGGGVVIVRYAVA